MTATSIYMALVHTRVSAPTHEASGLPGLSPGQAAGIVCNAIVERPAAIAPWWARVAGIAGSVARGPVEGALRQYSGRLPGERSQGRELAAQE